MIIKQSMLTMRILLDKDNRGSIDDNSCNSNECNECNECISNEYNECYECNSNECNKTPDHELSNKIPNDNSKNHGRINKNHQNNTNNFNNSRPIQYASKNDINNENVRKPSSAKRVYIA